MRKLKFILFLYLFAFIPSCMAQTVEREKAIHPGGDSEPAVIAAEIKTVKRHDKALLLVTFGSSWDAPHRTYRRMKEQFADRKSTRLNSSHANISYAVFCLKK